MSDYRFTNINTELLGRKAIVPSRETSDGVVEKLWLSRDGSLVTMDWLQALGLEGRLYAVHFGTATTPGTLETAYDADQPDINLDVPVGTIVVPVYFEVSPEATGAAGFEAHLMVSPTIVGAATSTAATPVNLRMSGASSRCTARINYTANGTDPTTGAVWLMNVSVNQDLDAVGIKPVFRWSIKDGPAPVVDDGGSINAYVYNATSGTAFATLIYAELDEQHYKV